MARTAKQGDVVQIVTCRCAGTDGRKHVVLVSERAAWRCGQCRSRGKDGAAFVLGERGSLPHPRDRRAPDDLVLS